MFNNKYNITLLNTKWNPIKTGLKLGALPRKDEFIYLQDLNKYFEVISIVHSINSKLKVTYFVIVDEFTQQPAKSI